MTGARLGNTEAGRYAGRSVSAVTAMAEKPDGKAKQPGTRPGYTTFRIYEKDGEDLSELASLTGRTISEVYRERCAPIIRKLVIEETERRLKELKGPR